MGAQVSKIMGRIFGSKEMRLLMLGLDAAGKTSTFSALVTHPNDDADIWYDSHSLQVKAEPRRYYHPNCWLQCRNSHLQECQV